MKKTKTTYDYFDTPTEVCEVVQLLLSKYEWILDGIINKVGVHFEPDMDGENFIASINVQREYRRVDIYITGKFLQSNDEERELAIAHELSHVITDPLYTVVNEIFDNFVETGVGDYVAEQIRKANESVVEDLSRIFVDFQSEEG